MQRPLARATLWKMALLLALVIALMTGLSYAYVVRTVTERELGNLAQYVRERVERERTVFALVERTQVAIRREMLRRLEEMGDEDPVERFEHLYRRYPDGVLRNRVAPRPGDRVTTGFIDESLTIDADVRRRMVVFEELVGRYGPVWEHVLPNLYVFDASDNMEAQYWPEQVDWDQNIGPDYDMSTEEWAYVSDVEHNPARETVWTGLYLDIAGVWMVSGSTPVDVDGRHIASIGHDIYLDALIERSIEDHLDGAYNVIFRQDGRLIADPERMEQSLAQGGVFDIERSGDERLQAVYRCVMADPEETILDCESVRSYLASARIEGPGWFFVMVVPKSAVTAAAWHAAVVVLFVGLVGFALAVLLLYVVLQRQVARPLQSLIAASERVAAGGERVRVPDGRQDELGRLASAFNVMVERVEDLVGGLETRVREREEAERALRESEAVAHAVLNAIQESLFLVDGDGVLLEVNEAAARRFGRRRAELVGVRVPGALPRPVEGLRAEERAELFASGKRVRFEEEREGSFYDYTLYPVHDEEGAVSRLAVYAVDTTVSRQAEEEKGQLEASLRQAQKMEAVGQLAGGVAHDFNNVLTAILGYADLLLAGDRLADGERGFLLEIQKAAEHAAGLTSQLLAFSRRQVSRPELVSLNDVLSRTTSMLGRLLPENITLQMGLGSGLPSVRVDPGQLEQVVVNLVVNARDAMPEGGELAVETAVVELDGSPRVPEANGARGRYAMLSVIDTGEGMDAEVREHVFEPFFTTKEVGAGTGLGLATVHGIVTQARGFLAVDSTPGQGSCFRLYLPAAAEEAPEQGVEAAKAEPEESGGTETVLLCEDERTVRELATKILQSAGYRVLAAEDSAEALRIADEQEGRFDLLLTDVVMPGMNGPALAEALAERYPALRVIYMSGYAEDVLSRHGGPAEGVDLIEKPFRRTTLLRRVREALTR